MAFLTTQNVSVSLSTLVDFRELCTLECLKKNYWSQSAKDEEKAKKLELSASPEHLKLKLLDKVKLPQRAQSILVSHLSQFCTKTISTSSLYDQTETSHLRLDDYIKIMQIGQGAYGDVWLADDMKNNRLVALKKLKFGEEREGFSKNGIREISLLRTLRKEYLRRVLGVGKYSCEVIVPYIFALAEASGDTHHGSSGALKTKPKAENAPKPDIPVSMSKGSVWMVFEYLPFDLNGIMEMYKERDEYLNLSEVKQIVYDILLALEFCHSRNVMHRDLKSANLLLSSEGRVKLADFGLARIFDSRALPLTNRVITFWYRPPELLLGADWYTPSVDIWSAGCIFAELLLNKALFGADREATVLKVIANILGPPCDIEWPDRKSLPLWNVAEANPLLCMPFLEPSVTCSQEIICNSSTQLSLGLGAREENAVWKKLFERVGALGLDLLKCMFRYNPKLRISAASALNHPWLVSAEMLKGVCLNRFSQRYCHAYAFRKDKERQKQKNASTAPPQKLHVKRTRMLSNIEFLRRVQRSFSSSMPASSVDQAPQVLAADASQQDTNKTISQESHTFTEGSAVQQTNTIQLNHTPPSPSNRQDSFPPPPPPEKVGTSIVKQVFLEPREISRRAHEYKNQGSAKRHVEECCSLRPRLSIPPPPIMSFNTSCYVPRPPPLPETSIVPNQETETPCIPMTRMHMASNSFCLCENKGRKLPYSNSKQSLLLTRVSEPPIDPSHYIPSPRLLIPADLRHISNVFCLRDTEPLQQLNPMTIESPSPKRSCADNPPHIKPTCTVALDDSMDIEPEEGDETGGLEATPPEPPAPSLMPPTPPPPPLEDINNPLASSTLSISLKGSQNITHSFNNDDETVNKTSTKKEEINQISMKNVGTTESDIKAADHREVSVRKIPVRESDVRETGKRMKQERSVSPGQIVESKIRVDYSCQTSYNQERQEAFLRSHKSISRRSSHSPYRRHFYSNYVSNRSPHSTANSSRFLCDAPYHDDPIHTSKQQTLGHRQSLLYNKTFHSSNFCVMSCTEPNWKNQRRAPSHCIVENPTNSHRHQDLKRHSSSTPCRTIDRHDSYDDYRKRSFPDHGVNYINSPVIKHESCRSRVALRRKVQGTNSHLSFSCSGSPLHSNHYSDYHSLPESYHGSPQCYRRTECGDHLSGGYHRSGTSRKHSEKFQFHSRE